MSRSKFKNMVECGKVRFASVAELRQGDPNELRYPKPIEDILDDMYFDYNEKMRNVTIPPTPRNVEIYNWRKTADNDDRFIFVNSWFMGESEQDEMWREYAPHIEDIAIQSTLGAVIESFSDKRMLFVDKIEYGDFKTMLRGPKHGLQRAIYKEKKKFAFESELRLILDGTFSLINANGIDENFRFVAVNLAKMIKRLVISPHAMQSDLSSLEAYLNKNKIQAKVWPSSLTTST